MSTRSGTVESAVRERTRAAILRAAVEVLTRDAAASMEEVASAAGVARSTLHRYYADRAALVDAVGIFVGTEYGAALERARPGDGTGLDAYTRICAELLDGLAVFAWWMRSAGDRPADPPDPGGDTGDPVVSDVLRRGQRDGSVDPTLDAGWLGYRVWAELYAAHHYRGGDRSRREIRETCLRTLVKAVAAAPAAR